MYAEEAIELESVDPAKLVVIENKNESYVGVEPDNSRARKGILIGVASAIGVLTLVIIITALVIKSPETEDVKIEIANITSSQRLDCLPKSRLYPSANDKQLCEVRNCIYDSDGVKNSNSPICYYNTNRYKFKVLKTEDTNLGKKYTIQSIVYGFVVIVEFEFLTREVFRFKLSKVLNSGKNYEVPIKVRTVENRAEDTIYDITVNSDNTNFYFKIFRKSTKQVIWDTSIGGLIFDKNFIQIATFLPSENVYGFGENNHLSFKHDLRFKSWPMFSRDQPPEWQNETNLYGVQPFYTCIEKDGSSHGVLLINSNAMDYEFLPEPALVYRTTGGILDFYAFLGPEPENVIQQFTDFIGRPFMPPYWALGFQVSRYGYTDLDDMKEVLVRMKQYGIPIDTQVADIDHMDERKMFTIDPVKWEGIDVYFKDLISQGMKTIILFDPFLIANESNYEPFNRGKNDGVFITWPNDVKNPDYQYTNSSIMVGYCWPKGRVAYPDFFKNSTQKWWINEIVQHRKNLIFNGLWNEPAVFGTNEEKPFNWPDDDKPYWTLKCSDDEYETVETKSSYLHRADNKLSDKTLCMNAVQGENNEYRHFDVHSLYGYSQQIPTFEAAQKLDNARGLVITRSNFIGTGKFAGHWTGDNHSKWSHIHYSIIGMLEFNLFGIPYVGADICGFWDNATEELCHRWSQIGAFYPFSRNHNGEINRHQDPASFSPEMALSVKKTLDIRYEILPYYYTLFYKAHTKGNTVVRPLFHEFPSDNKTYSIDRQFLVGPAILITPVIDEGKNLVSGYFPKDNWYSYYNGKKEHKYEDVASFVDIHAPIDFIPIHIRGGYIIPTQATANNTVYSRKNSFGLIVALDWDGEAKGDLYYDEGESKKFEQGEYYYATFIVYEKTLKMEIEHNNYIGMDRLKLDTIRIFVDNNKKLSFLLNGKAVSDNNILMKDNEVILKNLALPMNSRFELKWFDYRADLFGETRIDCSIENKTISQIDCLNKKCTFDSQATERVPKCYIPKGLGGYTITSASENHFELSRADNFSLYGNEIENLFIDTFFAKIDGKFDLARIKIYDGSKARYEVPVKLNMVGNSNNTNNRLKVSVSNSSVFNRAYFEVKSGDTVILDNRNIEHGFVYSDQFIQLAVNLGYKNVYGFGENSHYSFKHSFEYSNFWGIFARDQPPGGKEIGLYGTHPFLMAVNEKNGRAMGLLILNSNAMEYGFLPPQVFSYRTLGGILDVYIMEEESPENLIMAYTSLIGKPYMPPYWALGFQLCRYGYNSLENLKNAVQRTVKAGIPLDIQYADIDHFDHQLDFTYNEVNFTGLPEYIRELNSTGIRFIIILDPAINSEAENYTTFDRGTQNDIWIKWPNLNNPQKDEINGNNTYMLGYVWPEGKAVFPDFFLERTKSWWKNEIKMHFNTVPFDGLWIDMNEPANFDTNEEKPWNYPPGEAAWNLHCPIDNNLDNPPYLPLIARPYGNMKRMSDKTLCMNARQNGTFDHYDVHNLYGFSQSEPTLNALRETTNSRGIVISRSTYVSSGKYVGHWLGDNTSKWKDLKFNIIGLLEFNLFGIPYIGADICGFFGETTPELCERWMQLGAFNTFYRNHNGFGSIDQDPAALGDDVAYSSKIATETRYTLLPYLYTLFHEVSTNGGSVIRSLMHEFSNDQRTIDIDQQFLWGKSLLISPVLNPNTRTVFAYFPSDRWFDFYSGFEISETGRMHEIDAPSDHLPLHIRGGSILVTQKSDNNTRHSRMNSFGLIITPGKLLETTIKSRLYWDGGEEIDPKASSSEIIFKFDTSNPSEYQITNDILKNDFKFLETNFLETIRIFGQQIRPKSVTMSQVSQEDIVWKYNSNTKVIQNL